MVDQLLQSKEIKGGKLCYVIYFSFKLSLQGGVGNSGSLVTSSSSNMANRSHLWIPDPHFMDSYNDVVPLVVSLALIQTYL